MPRQISARIGAAGCTRQAAALLGALAAVGASAGISTDGTVGPATTLAGPDFRVGAELGTIRGTNLFHSFRVFNVLTGESATFTGPGRIANVIARVTGGSASNIDGLLRSQVGLADFYFINPAGVVLGPNAQVDVPAAFHASTADELRFKDGSRYSATDPGASSLTVAAPAAFGFLAARPASLKVNGSLLESGPGGRISLSGGNLRAQGAVLSAPGGRIDLTAVGGPAELPVDRPLATQASGRLTLEGTWIDSSGAGGGAASLRAGRLVLKGSGIYGDNTARGAASGGIDIGVGSLRLDDSIVAADASGAGRSAPVSVAVAEDAVLARYSSILSQTQGAGRAGPVWLEAGSLRLDTASAIYSLALGQGDSGQVGVSARGRIGLFADPAAAIPAEIFSRAEGAGDSGSVGVWAGSLTLDGSTIDSATGGAGKTGAVAIALDGEARLKNGSRIGTRGWGSGQAGPVGLRAGDLWLLGSDLSSLAIDGAAGSVSLGVDGLMSLRDGTVQSRTAGTGRTGDIAIAAGRIALVGGAQPGDPGSRIAAENAIEEWGLYGSGDTGDIRIEADSMRLDGQGALDLTAVRSRAYGGGTSGAIEVVLAGALGLGPGAVIESDTDGATQAGGVRIEAQSVTADGAVGTGSVRTGVRTSAQGAGAAGAIEIESGGAVRLFSGALIGSTDWGAGDGGATSIRAARMTIDGRGVTSPTGIVNGASAGTGNSGAVTVALTGDLAMRRGAEITSTTSGKGNSLGVSVQAERIAMDGIGTTIGSWSDLGPTGDAGPVSVVADGLLSILRGADIDSDAWGAGDAGPVEARAARILIDDRYTPAVPTGISSDVKAGASGQGGVLKVSAQRIEILNGGEISVATAGSGDAGEVLIEAGALVIDGGIRLDRGLTGISSSSLAGASGDAGRIEVRASGSIELNSNAQIVSSVAGTGDGSEILVQGQSLAIDGSGADALTGILTIAAGGTGDASSVTLKLTDSLSLIGGGAVDASTYGAGDAGAIAIDTELFSVSGIRDVFPSGVFSRAEAGSTGNAGDIRILARRGMGLADGGQISVSTGAVGSAGVLTVETPALTLDGGEFGLAGLFGVSSGAGAGGTVSVQVAGTLALTDGGWISSTARSSGNAGHLSIRAGRLSVANGSLIDSASRGTGAAGNISVKAGELELGSDSWISTDTWGPGPAGQILVEAGRLLVDGHGMPDLRTGIASTANLGSSGDAGTVTVLVAGGSELLAGATITAGTFGAGDAGNVWVQTGTLRMSGAGGLSSLIDSSAQAGSGNGGSVTVAVGGLADLSGGAAVSTSTYGAGNAGSVAFSAAALRIDGSAGPGTGLYSTAGAGSSGFAGRIDLAAGSLGVFNGGEISVASRQWVPESRLGERPNNRIRIQAGQLHLSGAARITTESAGNVPAGAIEIVAGEMLAEGASRIATEANAGDGGTISISGGRLWLRDSLIATSVLGTAGDGGDILLNPDYLILEGGFIQANTAAAGARGGDITIGSKALVASNGSLLVGGDERLSFAPGSGLNVIQAAAPGGEHGLIQIAAPELDISGTLATLASPFVDPTGLISDPCRIGAGGSASSLVMGGRGGLPPAPEGPAMVSFGGRRLDRLLAAAPGAGPGARP